MLLAGRQPPQQGLGSCVLQDWCTRALRPLQCRGVNSVRRLAELHICWQWPSLSSSKTPTDEHTRQLTQVLLQGR